MTRPLRVEYPGALYHVIARGNEKQNIFRDDTDRTKFLNMIADCVQNQNLICHSYCLMSNHYHFLIETVDANLAHVMRNLNGNYARWFNVRHSRVGHLFQGRYQAFVVEKDSYLLTLARYIVLNPVRANFVADPKDWEWSSYNAIAGNIQSPDWLFTDWLLNNFSINRNAACREYKQFVKDGIGSPDPYRDTSNELLLGSPQFVHSIWEKTVGSEDVKEHPRSQRIVGRPSLEDLFSDVSNKQDRDAMIMFASVRCGYLATEIAVFAKLDPAVVNRIVKGTYNKKS